MRTVTDHIVEGDSVNHQLTILVLDDPGAGGANHQYQIGLPAKPRGDTPEGGMALSDIQLIGFQNGPIKEVGVNGVTHEALLAIVIDRLRSFQAGPFKCDENAHALSHAELCLAALQQRTRARIARNVEGTHEK